MTLSASANFAAHALSGGDSLEDRFALLEREQQIESLLLELKGDQAVLSEPATLSEQATYVRRLLSHTDPRDRQ